jgi:hypothetical protein
MPRFLHSKTNRLLFAVCLLLLSLGNFNQAMAQTPQNCSGWVPTIEQYYDNGTRVSRKPEFVKLSKAALFIDSMVKKNPHFTSIAPARFRTSLVLTNGTPQLVQLNIKAYSREGWDNKCGLIPQADRIGADHAGICVRFNKTGFGYTTLEVDQTRDEKLYAFKEPVITKTVGGQPVYYQNRGNHFLLMTYNNQVPWEPVPMEEYLDYIERRLLQKIKDYEEEIRAKPPTIAIQDPKKNGYYLELKKTDPKKAEEFLAQAEKMNREIEIANKEVFRLTANNEAGLKNDLAEFRALRAAFSPAELKKQAIRGNSKFWLYTDKFPTLKDPLVKIKREFVDDRINRDRLKIISIWAGGTYDDWDEQVQKVMETLDYNAIKKLMK